MNHVFKRWPKQYLVDETSSGSFSFFMKCPSLPVFNKSPSCSHQLCPRSRGESGHQKRWGTRAEATQTAQHITEGNGVHS